jgi:hypothetical protein
MKNNILSKVDLENPYQQYGLGLLFCLIIYTALYLGSTTSFSNIQIPVGNYSQNMWSCSDFLSYYNPAKNFVEYGVFGDKYIPDNFRTIGYPFYLATLMFIFKSHWLYMAYFIHCLIFPLIFPALFYITKIFTNNIIAKQVFCFSLLSGIYTSRCIFIGTDLFFCLFFIVGIYFLVKFFTVQKYQYLIYYLSFISIAAVVRPSLIYYPIINVFLFFYLKNKCALDKKKPFIKPLLISTFILLITCNIPSIRNYNNYQFFKPSTVLNTNYFEYFAKNVYLEEKQLVKYDSLLQTIALQPIKQQMELQAEYTIEAIKEHPIAALKVLKRNVEIVLFDNHLTNVIGNYFGYNWRYFPNYYISETLCYGYQASPFLFVVYFIFMGIYCLIYIAFGLFIIRSIRAKDYATLLLLASMMVLLFFPVFISGTGASRFRMQVEWIILIFAFQEIATIRTYIKK